MPTLSIIIPIYNGANYIVRCLNSIILQRPLPNEIILIDDGSKDNSFRIIRQYIKQHSYSSTQFILLYQENAGVAAARNLGITTASSDYISFADQDDYFEPDFCKTMLKAAVNHNYDMIIGGFSRKDNSGKTTRRVIPSKSSWSKFMLTYPWGRIIKRSFLIENNIRFLKTSIGEDVYFDMVAYSYTENICIVPHALYVWFNNPKSVSNTNYKSSNTLIDPTFTFNSILRNFCHANQIPIEYQEYYFLKFCVWYLLYSGKGQPYENLITMRNKLFNWLKHNYPNYSDNTLISPFMPKSDLISNRLVVWFYQRLYEHNLDNIVLKVISKM